MVWDFRQPAVPGFTPALAHHFPCVNKHLRYRGLGKETECALEVRDPVLMDEVEAPSVLVKRALSSDSSKTFRLVSYVNLPVLPSPGWHKSCTRHFSPCRGAYPL